MSTLYYGDNLDILQRYVKDESVDLIYLDPPFNSNASYNVLFDDKKGEKSAAQLQAFKDTWSWEEAALTYQELTLEDNSMGDALRAFGALLPKGGMLAYLTMMAPRLQKLRDVLKPTGSIYLHCDPTAGHYLKVLMDSIFGAVNFQNQITWKRTTTKGDYRQGAFNWPRISDLIFYYTKDHGTKPIFTQLFAPYTDDYVATKYSQKDKDGRAYMLDNLTAPGAGTRGHPQYELMGVTRYWRYNKEKMLKLVDEGRVIQPRPGAVPRYKRYLDEMPGVAIGDFWEDIPPINSQAKERLGYPTQKPEALLERIIKASSNEGDTILDPFCGCGTAIAVAQRLNRHWLGIDITQAAIQTIKMRLADSFGDIKYKIVGEPVSVYDAQKLANDDPYQFQWWSLGLAGARPTEQKKGADKGIDGRLFFFDGQENQQIIFSVKAGHTGPNHVNELRGVIEREGARIGVLITMQEPTRPMKACAGEAGYYQSQWGNHPKLQILTVTELLAGKGVDYPNVKGANITYKQAPKAKGGKGSEQLTLPPAHEDD